jgi:hypothetical protein
LKVLLNGRFAHLAVLEEKEAIHAHAKETSGFQEFYLTLAEVYRLQRDSLEVEIASMLVTLKTRSAQLEWEEEISINDLNELGKLISSMRSGTVNKKI